MLTKNFLKRARKSGFWPTFYHSLRLQEKLYHIWCIILHCIIDQSFKQISPHLKEYSMEIHPKWGQGGCFHASMPSDIIFTLNFSFANSVIPLPQGFLYFLVIFGHWYSFADHLKSHFCVPKNFAILGLSFPLQQNWNWKKLKSWS